MKPRLLTVACLLGILGLAACAGSPGGDSTPTSEAAERRPSDECSYGVVIEWDASPGPDTRAEAVLDHITALESQLRMSATPGALPDTETLKLSAAVRLLRAALDELPDAEADTSPTASIIVTPVADDGAELGEVYIDAQSSAGYRVGMIGARGFDTDGPQCTASPVVSEICSVEERYGPAALPAAASRAGAIRAVMTDIEDDASFTDRVQRMVALRGLQALLDLLPQMLEPADAESFDFSAFHDNGWEVGWVEVAPHPDGGHFVSSFRATAFTTDDAACE